MYVYQLGAPVYVPQTVAKPGCVLIRAQDQLRPGDIRDGRLDEERASPRHLRDERDFFLYAYMHDCG